LLVELTSRIEAFTGRAIASSFTLGDQPSRALTLSAFGRGADGHDLAVLLFGQAQQIVAYPLAESAQGIQVGADIACRHVRCSGVVQQLLECDMRYVGSFGGGREYTPQCMGRRVDSALVGDELQDWLGAKANNDCQLSPANW